MGSKSKNKRTSAKASRSSDPIASLQQEYPGAQLLAHDLIQEAVRQLDHLLKAEGIALGFPIQSRVKRWDSLREKVSRLGRPITSVWDFQDLAGIRLLLLFRRDVDRVCNVIDRNFDKIRRYDTSHRLNADQFGYSSTHYVVRLPSSWLSVPTLAHLRDRQMEIQIRTLAQHLWAEASNNLQYKNEGSVPEPVGRAVYRTSALLETLDLEFDRVLELRDLYRAEIRTTEINDVTDVDVLERVLDGLLPDRNKVGDEDYAALLEELQHWKVANKNTLQALWKKHQAAVVEEDRQYRGIIFGNEGDDQVTDRAYFNHTGLVRMALAKEFQEYEKWLLKKTSWDEDAVDDKADD